MASPRLGAIRAGLGGIAVSRFRLIAVVSLLAIALLVPSGTLAYPPPVLVGPTRTLTGTGSLSGLTITTKLYKVFDPALGCAAYQMVSSFKWSKLPPNGVVLLTGDPDAFVIDYILPTNYLPRSASISGTWFFQSYVFPDSTDSGPGVFTRISGGSTWTPHFRFAEKEGRPGGHVWMKNGTITFNFNKLSGCNPSAPQYANLTPRYVRTLDTGSTNWSFSVAIGGGPISASLTYTPNTVSGEVELTPGSAYQYGLP
jgi:hypothetical protein